MAKNRSQFGFSPILVLLIVSSMTFLSFTAFLLRPIDTTKQSPKNGSGGNTMPDPKPVEGGGQINSSTTKANNRFGGLLMRKVMESDRESNKVISPTSVYLALSMAANGAADNTLSEMIGFLSASAVNTNPGQSIMQVNMNNFELMKYFNSGISDVEISVANSVWVTDTYQLNDLFKLVANTQYMAEASTLDFSNPASSDTINGWVSEETKDKISSIVPKPLPKESILYLINAIYFKGTWTETFDVELTEDKDFFPFGAAEPIQHPTMVKRSRYDYYEDTAVQAVRLPYGEDESMSMEIFLPKQPEDLGSLRPQEEQDRIPVSAYSDIYEYLESNIEYTQRLGKAMYAREGTLEIPRFTIEYDRTLNGDLKALGMRDAFDPSAANLPGLVQVKSPGQNVYISEVVHKTFIEVNEEGTEAAAATSVAITPSDVSLDRPEPPFVMRVNRPFFFTIKDNESGLILFMGVITNPVS